MLSFPRRSRLSLARLESGYRKESFLSRKEGLDRKFPKCYVSVSLSTAMSVEVVSRNSGKRVSARKLKSAARRILQILDQDRAELSLALVDNREIQELNARYRKKDEATDVLSFPSGKQFSTAIEILGDVIISVEQAEKQARKRRKPLEQEIENLLIHGILHLLGYDHERSKKDAKIMRGMEKKVSRALCETAVLRV